MRKTRLRVEQGWAGVASRLESEGHSELAMLARHFLESMPSPQAERELRARRARSELKRDRDEPSR